MSEYMIPSNRFPGVAMLGLIRVRVGARVRNRVRVKVEVRVRVEMQGGSQEGSSHEWFGSG